MNCYRCKKDMKLGEKILRGDSCHHCHFDARVCRNCEFYDPQAYNECRETSADRVVDKEKSNFCDFFKYYDQSAGGAAKPDPKAAAQALFKK